MARRPVLIASLLVLVLAPGCSALGLFDRAPAIACIEDVDCTGPALSGDPCVVYHCDHTLALCAGALADRDHDGTGATGCASSAFATPDLATDCNDGDATVHVGGLELCGGSDNDCDGIVDESCVTPAIATGDDHACYLAGETLICWGSNNHGQIGIGDASPVGPHPRRVAIDDAIAITAGQWTTCATRVDGHVSCWGDASAQELALPTPPSRYATPTDVPALHGATSVTLGVGYGCAIFDAGEVRCWGGNLYGIFGAATPASSTTPIPIPGVIAMQVDAGSAAACAVLVDGHVSCWGMGSAAAVDDAACTATDPSAPCNVSNVSDAVEVSVGGDHACARTHDGSLMCWGNNGMGALGTDTVAMTGFFLPSLPSSADSITAGGSHTCTTVGGRLWCWGSNEQLQLGLTTATLVTQPMMIQGLASSSFASVAAGRAHTCGLLASGDVLCWGENIAGQLGGITPLLTSSMAVAPLETWGADGQP